MINCLGTINLRKLEGLTVNLFQTNKTGPDTEITIEMLPDGTVNILTGDGGVTKIWPPIYKDSIVEIKWRDNFMLQDDKIPQEWIDAQKRGDVVITPQIRIVPGSGTGGKIITWVDERIHPMDGRRPTNIILEEWNKLSAQEKCDKIYGKDQNIYPNNDPYTLTDEGDK
jgi:hypothetical protein